jgi:hypothetical protein
MDFSRWRALSARYEKLLLLAAGALIAFGIMEKKETEISALFAGIAAALSFLSAALSLLCFNRVL